MKLSDRLLPIFVVGVLLAGVGALAARWIWPESTSGTGLIIPTFSKAAAQGQIAFDANCAQCHGSNAAGTAEGPPLVHDIYNPGHHADEAFFRAAKRGVPQHHWPFGNMPPRPDVSDKELTTIVRYIRELQEANGIFYRPHNM
jgi:mono/diheme cytochrome c family protein